MRLDLNTVCRHDGEEYSIDYTADFSGIGFDGRYHFACPVSVKGSVRNYADELLLGLTIDTHMDAVCDRCLADVTQHLHFCDEYYIMTDSEAGTDGKNVLIAEDNLLDIDELVYGIAADIYLSKQLCGPDCKGLCPMCGTNLNERNCGCVADTADPRLSKLKEFFSQNSQEV